MHKAKLQVKVLMLTGGFSPCPQSSSQRFSSFADALLSRGARVIVGTPTRCLDKIKTPLQDKGVLVYDFDCPRLLLSFSNVVINPVILLQYFFLSLILAAQKKVNVIFASVPNGETAIAGFFIAKLFQFPLIIDIRDVYPPSSVEFSYLYLHVPSRVNDYLTSFFLFLYRNADKVVCAYTKIEHDLRKSGVSPKKTFFIPNGADTSIYTPCNTRKRETIRSKYGLSMNKIIFVYTGALSVFYAVANVIKAANNLLQKRDDFQLLVISYMSYNHLEKMAKRMGIEGNVKFLGPLPVRETAEIISACDVGVVPNPGDYFYKDFSGSKIFSYMSCGLPILVSGGSGGFNENLLRENRIGFFVGDPYEKNFERGFMDFLRAFDKTKITGMRKNARKIVEKSFDRKKLGLKLTSLIFELMTTQTHKYEQGSEGMIRAESLKDVEKEWNRIYRDRKIEDDVERQHKLETYHTNAFNSLFSPGSCVLEAGCGFGRYCFWFENRGIESIGIDIARYAIRTGKRFGKAKEYSGLLLIGDVMNLPFRNSVFDGYVSLGVLEHFHRSEDVEKTFEEAFRVLQLSGQAYFSVLNPVAFGGFLPRIFNVFGLSVYRHPVRDLVLKAQTTGFEVEKVNISGVHYLFYLFFRFIFGREVWSLKQAIRSTLDGFDRFAPFCYLGSTVSLRLKKTVSQVR